MKRLLLPVFMMWMMSLSTVYGQVFTFDHGVMSNDDINTLPTRAVVNGKAMYVEITYEFTGAEISEVFEGNEKFQFMHISGFGEMQQIGAPALPAHNDIIAMPVGANAKIVLLETQFNEYPGFNIHPALAPATDTEGDPEPEFYKDEKIYTSDALFPGNIVDVVETRMYGDSLTYYPMPYLRRDNILYYKSAYNMDQTKIMDMVSVVQPHIDQGISTVLYVTSESTTKDLARYYYYAYKKGLKSLYYIRTKNLSVEECETCSV